MDTISIIHEEIVTIERDYYQVKSVIQDKLRKWSDLYVFDDLNHRIRYKTEGPLIPDDNSKIPVLILLSNPHPNSVKQGMFLSPNRGRANPFWDTLRDTGFFTYDGKIDATVMIKNEYQSPFRFFMAVLFPFPTKDPTHLINFFGKTEYKKMIETSKATIKKLIVDYNIMNIICFGKTQYDIMKYSHNTSNNYISFLKKGEIIQDKIWFSEIISIYLTYPTGWRYAKDQRSLKKEGLKKVLNSIVNN
ncbi:MAG: hypothetical protein JW914_01055 [Syntrophaceae bacterium]|nr:hypothetical protein [Syntrophaceae bacterium]